MTRIVDLAIRARRGIGAAIPVIDRESIGLENIIAVRPQPRGIGQLGVIIIEMRVEWHFQQHFAAREHEAADRERRMHLVGDLGLFMHQLTGNAQYLRVSGVYLIDRGKGCPCFIAVGIFIGRHIARRTGGEYRLAAGATLELGKEYLVPSLFKAHMGMNAEGIVFPLP